MKQLIVIITIFIGKLLLACPNCAGSDNAKDKYTVYILAVFILLIYIPFYILFKMAHKMNPQKEDK